MTYQRSVADRFITIQQCFSLLAQFGGYNGLKQATEFPSLHVTVTV
jgi:hypothetical protein